MIDKIVELLNKTEAKHENNSQYRDEVYFGIIIMSDGSGEVFTNRYGDDNNKAEVVFMFDSIKELGEKLDEARTNL